MSKTSLDEALSTWGQLLEGIEANQGDLPHIEDYGEQLEVRLKDLKVLRERRKRLQTKVHRATREYEAALAEGRDLAARIRYSIHGRYGRNSDKLTEFGLTPRKKRKPAERPATAAIEDRGGILSRLT